MSCCDCFAPYAYDCTEASIKSLEAQGWNKAEEYQALLSCAQPKTVMVKKTHRCWLCMIESSLCCGLVGGILGCMPCSHCCRQFNCFDDADVIFSEAQKGNQVYRLYMKQQSGR